MQDMPYSLMLDGSNDTSLSKIFPVTGRVFDVNFNRVMTKFFDMNLIGSTDAPTAEAMFETVDNQLNNLDINWGYVWLRSMYSWIFWYHKLAINRTSRVIRHVGGRIYQATVKGDVPENILEEAFVKDTPAPDQYRMGMVWGYLWQRFPVLCEIALAILVVPHSNAVDESLFSMIRKNKTEFRSSLDLSKSLNSVMRVKMDLPE